MHSYSQGKTDAHPHTGSFNNGGVNANYWASTVNDADNAYNANFDTDGNANSANNNNRNNGNQVRCIASS